MTLKVKEKRGFFRLNNDMKATLKEAAITVGVALLVATVFRSLFFDPFHVPSGSMMPTLLPGDRMFVSKYAYGYTKHSFPFKIFPIHNVLFGNKPKRGDIVVFALPSNQKIFYVKRVIGLPGDTIKLTNCEVFVNGEKLSSSPVDHDATSYTDNNHELNNIGFSKPSLFEEISRDGKKYRIIKPSKDELSCNTKTFKVPNGHCFVMGDNRGNSVDSRFNEVGFIPIKNIIGKPLVIFFSSEKGFISSVFSPKSFRFKRFFTNLIPELHSGGDSATDIKD